MSTAAFPQRFILRPQDVEVHAPEEQFDAEWDEEKHPRDERGRWARGGPGGSGPGTGKWGKAVWEYIHRGTYDDIRAAQLGKGPRSQQSAGRAALTELNEAFQHAPVFEGVAYRGLSFSSGKPAGYDWAHTPAGREPKYLPEGPPQKEYRDLEKLRAGDALNLKCYQSFSSSETIGKLATSPMGWSRRDEGHSYTRMPKSVGEPTKYSAVLAVTTDKGRDVSHHAGNFKWQKEVLLGPTARIRVTKVEKDSQGRLWIHGRHL